MRFNIKTLRARAEAYRRELFEARVRDFVERAVAEVHV
jgi:hypothetical protein